MRTDKYLLGGLLSLMLLSPVIVVAATTALSAPAISNDERDAKVLNSLLNTSISSTLNARSVSRTDGRITRLVQIARQRRNTMQKLAKHDPAAFLRNVIPATKRASLPTAVQEEVESAVALTGSVKVLYVDDFITPANSEVVYTLNSNGTDLALQIAGDVPEMTSDSIVRVNGYQLGESVIAAGSTDGVTVVNTPTLLSIGDQRTLVVLLTSAGYPVPPTPQQMETYIFSGDTQNFYKEQSNGKTWFSGDVTDWISVAPYRGTRKYKDGYCYPDYTGPSINLRVPAIQTYLKQHNIDPSQYSRLLFILNDAHGGCAFTSQGWVGWRSSDGDVDGVRSILSDNQYALAHELGHVLGLPHANSWECKGPSIVSNCFHNEYGNNYDAMGHGALALHFNAHNKERLGWLDNSSKVPITGNGTYSLAPLEVANGVRTAIWGGLYVEFRQPIGYDSELDPRVAGLQINHETAGSTRLINANYAIFPKCTGSGCPRQPWSLMPGSTFTWANRGITIQNVRINSGTATFDFKYEKPICILNGLVLSEIVGNDHIPANSGGQLTFNVTNNDTAGCSLAYIKVTVTVPSSTQWSSQVIPEGVIQLGPGESSVINIKLSPLVTPATIGNTKLQITMKDNPTSRLYTVERTFTVVEPPTITSITPVSGAVGSSVTVRGTGFNEAPNTNTVTLLDLAGHLATIRQVSATNGAITFTIPALVSDGSIATPQGQYTISVTRDTDFGSANSPTTFAVVPEPSRAISGKITYNNATQYPMFRAVVSLIDSNGVTSASATTCIDINVSCDGSYSFTNLPQPASAYTISVRKDPPINDGFLASTNIISSLIKLITYMSNPNIGTPEQRASCDLTSEPAAGATSSIDLNDFLALLKFMNTKKTPASVPFPNGNGWIFTPKDRTVVDNVTIQDFTTMLRGDCAGTLYNK